MSLSFREGRKPSRARTRLTCNAPSARSINQAALERTGDSAAVARLHSPPGTILRPALTPQHETDYRAAAAKLPEVRAYVCMYG